jgi:hypothetical protein
VVVVDDVAVAVMWSSLLPGVVIVIVVEVAWPKRAVTRAFDNDSDGRALGTWLEHGWIFDEALGRVSRIVGGAIVLALRIRCVRVVVRNRGWWVRLLWTLSCGGLRLLVGRLRRVLRALGKRKRRRRGLLGARKTFDVFVPKRVADSKPRLLVGIIEAL